ncbi:hypothetical protein B0A49_02669 [Cryomyces minteri]|uniref:Uncharacterized protein n=1 Tax=Cryomyces minteri TaxID=331657 RepID=A0A4U0X7W9_9PEZI|nr:hypothetical protein B0A49_02669 [Cryomyces minteri]
MSTPGKGEKIMSSRLLTMKFMQRAAASPGTASPSTPDGRPTKRQRMSNGSTPTTPSSDLQAMQAAMAAEELKRTAALERAAADAGESKWVLSFQDPEDSIPKNALNVISAGFSMLDSPGTYNHHSSAENEEDEQVQRPQVIGRRSFGKFNSALEKQQNPDASSSSSDSSSASESSDIEDDPTGTKALIRQSRKDAADKAKADRKAKKKADKAEALRMAEKRRSKEVKLNREPRGGFVKAVWERR